MVLPFGNCRRRVLFSLLAMFASWPLTTPVLLSRFFSGFPYVVVRQIRLIEREQRVLEVIEYILFRFAVSYVLQEVQVSLVSTPELVIQGLDLADFMQTAVLQDRSGLDGTGIDGL